MLQQLKAYADTLAADGGMPSGYQPTWLRNVISLDEQGNFLGWVKLSDGKGGKKDKGLLKPAPHLGRTVAIKAKLLADNGEYVLGAAKDPGKQCEKVRQRQQAFNDLTRACADETGEAGVLAIARFLERQKDSPIPLPEGFDANDVVTFRVGDYYPIDQPSVQRFWAERLSDDGDNEAWVSTCIVCGNVRPIASTHPVLIKGAPGGQTSGTAVVSANEKAFESYGLENSQIAPTCSTCAEGYANGLNALLSDENRRIYLKSVAVVYWTRSDFNLRATLLEPEEGWFDKLLSGKGEITVPSSEELYEQQVKALLKSPLTGRVPQNVDEEAFYALTISGSGARTVFRDWMETTVGNVRGHLKRYFNRQAIVSEAGGKPRPLSLLALANSLVRDPAKEFTAETQRALLSHAIKGSPLPANLLHQAVRRNRVEQQVTTPRAALIKMVLASTSRNEEPMEQLNPEHPSPAYHCGRLLAVLAQIQHRSQGKVNATLTDRHYGAASTAPASTFPRLLSLSRHHLAKIRKESEGTAIALEKRLEEIMGALKEFPRTLSLDQQGLFALGFYHQQAHDRGEAIARKEAKDAKAREEAGKSTASEALPTA